jgi:hypothetical protein
MVRTDRCMCTSESFQSNVAINYDRLFYTSFAYYYYYVSVHPFLGPWPHFQFLDPIQLVGLLGQGISPLQGFYLHTINAHNTDIHALSGIRTHDLSIRASEDSSCLRPRAHCDRQFITFGRSIATADECILKYTIISKLF